MERFEGAQAWLPVGQLVQAPDDVGFYVPQVWAENSGFAPSRRGSVAEHLIGGGIAVVFEGYPNVIDYSAREAHRFTRRY